MQALDEVEAEGDEKIGVELLRRALEAPAKQIAFNAGKEGAVVVEEIKKQEGNTGYNAKDDKYEDLIAAGIVDPTKVTRSALENAASVASMILTMETVVGELPEKKEDMPAMPPGGGGMPGGMDMGGMM